MGTEERSFGSARAVFSKARAIKRLRERLGGFVAEECFFGTARAVFAKARATNGFGSGSTVLLRKNATSVRRERFLRKLGQQTALGAARRVCCGRMFLRFGESVFCESSGNKRLWERLGGLGTEERSFGSVRAGFAKSRTIKRFWERLGGLGTEERSFGSARAGFAKSRVTKRLLARLGWLGTEERYFGSARAVFAKARATKRLLARLSGLVRKKAHSVRRERFLRKLGQQTASGAARRFCCGRMFLRFGESGLCESSGNKTALGAA